MQLMRSWLFVPGNQPRMLSKAMEFAADALILDLEDSVPPSEKQHARSHIAAAIDKSSATSMLCVRTSTNRGAELERDLAAVVRPGLDALVLPKVESAQEVLAVETILDGLADRETSQEIHLFATIETSQGLIEAAAIAASSSRLTGLFFGAEDFALDLGLLGGGNSDSMLYARSAIAIAAASSQLMAIDRVVTDFRNAEFLKRDSQQALQMGFCGKAVIHPAQVDVVNTAFTPRSMDVVQAQRVINEYERGAAEGIGAIQLDGKMVDLPVVNKARRIIELAEAAALRRKSGVNRRGDRDEGPLADQDGAASR